VINRLSHVSIYVLDRTRAQFYTEVLALKWRSDTSLDGFRC